MSEATRSGRDWHSAIDKLRGSEIESIFLRLAVLFVVGLFLTIATDTFLTQTNLVNLLRQASLMFLLAAGLTLVLIVGGIDLSVGANLALSACLTAGVYKATNSVPLAIATGLATGAAIGFVNSLLVAFLKLPPFLATFATLWVCQGLAFFYMSGSVIYGFPPEMRALGSGFWLGIPVPVILMTIILIFLTVFLRRSTIGHELYAIGSNATAARLSGIPVRRRLILVYVLSGLTAGFAGIVYLARVNSADAGVGEPLLLPVIAVVLIGGASLYGGRGSAIGTLSGALILTAVLNGMNLLAIDSNLQPMAAGLVVLLALALEAVSKKHQRKK
ncbi:MAG: ABC transporter permease [Phyllobacteriaceae bacterium]|jgi:ribose transport system permease protein|nr:ABC transporter permease [Phyllobacteriaceae bacterium]